MRPIEDLRALVVGCGRIGARWDKPGQAEILTHAHAYRMRPDLDRLGFVDSEAAAARNAAEKWGGLAFPDLPTALSELRPQAVSVCVPDAEHYQVLSSLLDSEALLIFAEKPITLDPRDADEVVRRARIGGKVINVNYSRRFDPIVAEIRKGLQSGAYGKVLNAVGYYTKGIIHNGSHMIDLLRHLLGEVEAARFLSRGPGHGPGDPTLDCWLRFEGCPSAHLVGLEEEAYSVHELDLFCEKGRLRLTRFGFRLESQKVEEDPLFPGYRQLSDPEIRPTGLTGAMGRYIENGLRALRGSEKPLCPAEDAARTLKVCKALLDDSEGEEAIG